MSESAAPITYKIIVTGPFSSGKTALVKSIGDPVPPVDPNYFDRIAMDMSCIASKDETIALYLFGTPGSRRFDFLWEIVEKGMIGFIVMINSHNPQTFRQTQSDARTMAAYAPMSYIYAANFQDHPDAWSVDDLRIALRIEPEMPIVPCIATDRESVRGVLLALMDEVLRDIAESS